MAKDYNAYVHEYVDRLGRTWWVVAEYRDGRYQAPLDGTIPLTVPPPGARLVAQDASSQWEWV